MLCPHADQALQSFLYWCSQAGIRTGGLEVRCSPGRGRLLQATRRFVADEEMLSVPADAIISEGAAGQSYQASHWTLAVAHRLVEEDCLGSDSRFWPYIQLLLEGPWRVKGPNSVPCKSLKFVLPYPPALPNVQLVPCTLWIHGRCIGILLKFEL